jgi:hypothetical protein
MDAAAFAGRVMKDCYDGCREKQRHRRVRRVCSSSIAMPRGAKGIIGRSIKLHVNCVLPEALFKDPPAKEDCPICFLPMPKKLICCVSLPPATRSSVPINDFADEYVELAKEAMDGYYQCCGKSICRGCEHSFAQSGNGSKCPFYNFDQAGKTDEEKVEEIMKRVEANDAASNYLLANSYYHQGLNGIQQDLQRQLNYSLRQQNLVAVRHIITWVTFIMKGEI